jgi:hypothetical protein
MARETRCSSGLGYVARCRYRGSVFSDENILLFGFLLLLAIAAGKATAKLAKNLGVPTLVVSGAVFFTSHAIAR